jgi:acetyl-CoA/propionyl-CoA carboxylase, biotin carboxylase, biotin carboxyl carrier protein
MRASHSPKPPSRLPASPHTPTIHHPFTGDSVAEGTPLLILEAMKMEHVIKAPAAGSVGTVRFAPGEFVQDGQELATVVAGKTEGAKA